NAWLQECPKPLTKQVWGNALHVSAADAGRLGLVDGDVVRVALAEQSVELPVHIEPGHAEGVVSTTVGYGRQTGTIAHGVGGNCYALRPPSGEWHVNNVSIAKTGRHQ